MKTKSFQKTPRILLGMMKVSLIDAKLIY